MLINGERVDSASGGTFETLNPASEDVRRAVGAARAAFALLESLDNGKPYAVAKAAA